MADLYHYTFSLPWWIALLFGVLLLPFHMFLVMVVRARVRWKHNLEGNACSDTCCLVCCCWPLVVCQLRDQIHYLRSQKQWKLGYAQEFGDTPPWIKPCLRLRDAIKRRRRKKNKDIEDGEECTESDEDEVSANQEDEKQNKKSQKTEVKETNKGTCSGKDVDKDGDDGGGDNDEDKDDNDADDDDDDCDDGDDDDDDIDDGSSEDTVNDVGQTESNDSDSD